MEPVDPTSSSMEQRLSDGAWVRALARRMLADPGLADDAAQEGAIAAWKQGHVETQAAAGWLATTVRRLALRMRRSEDRRAEREQSVARPEALPSAVELVERAEAHRALVAAVLALEEPYRSTILLRYVEDLPPRAIARRAGVPIATVKSRLARGLEKLRRELGRGQRDARGLLGLLVPPALSHAKPLILGGSLVKSLKLAIVALVLLLLGVGLVRVMRPAQQPGRELAAVQPLAAPETTPELPAEGGAPVARASMPTPTDRARDGAAVLLERERVHGRVLDMREQPIVDAQIDVVHTVSSGYQIFDFTLQDPTVTIAGARSGAQGEFECEVPFGTVFDLWVSAGNFADERILGLLGSREVVVHLGRCARIFGEVTRAEDGFPVAGAIVRIDCGMDAAIDRVTHTDEFGRYDMDDVSPGRTGIIVAPREDCLTAYEEHTLRPGEQLRRDFQVRAGERVRGRVVDAATGASIRDAGVSPFDFIYKTVGTDAHGEFEIAGLDRRQLTLTVRAEGYGRVDQRVLDFREPVVIALHAGRRAHGRVLGLDSQPVAGAFVAALGIADNRKDVRPARTDARGEFVLQDLRTDLEHVLLARAEGFGSTFLAFPAGTLDASAIEFGDIRLERSALLEGRALDDSGAPRGGVDVTLKPVLAAPMLQTLGELHGVRDCTTDAGGRFVFRDVAPGSLSIAARGPGLVAVEPVSVHLSAGEQRRGFEIRLATGLAIEGLVRDARGQPVEGAWVSVGAEGAARGRGSMATDENGHFCLRGLSAGGFVLEVRGPASEFEMQDRFEPIQLRHVQAGCAALDLHLLERTSTIRGRVLDAQANPVAGAFVWRLDGKAIPPNEFVISDADGRFELAVSAGDRLQLMARRGLPLVAALRTPTQREFRAGRVMLDDPEPIAVSGAVAAGSEGVELRIPREYGAPK